VRSSRTGALVQQQWGWFAARPVPGDYDGDGKTDHAVYHPATGEWYIRESTTGELVRHSWGWSAAFPLPRFE
jgi:hypothetical protein